MKYSDIISKVSKDLNISEEVVDYAYKSYWNFIKQTIQKLPLKEDIDEKEFSSLRTNFNIPSLGKLYLTWDRFLSYKKRFKLIGELKNKL